MRDAFGVERISKAVTAADYRKYLTNNERRTNTARILGGASMPAAAILTAPTASRSGRKDILAGIEGMKRDKSERKWATANADRRGLPTALKESKPNRKGVYNIRGKEAKMGRSFKPTPSAKLFARGMGKTAIGAFILPTAVVAAAANNIHTANRSQRIVEQRKAAAMRKNG